MIVLIELDGKKQLSKVRGQAGDEMKALDTIVFGESGVGDSGGATEERTCGLNGPASEVNPEGVGIEASHEIKSQGTGNELVIEICAGAVNEG